MKNLDSYVGRNIRLNQKTFQVLTGGTRGQGADMDNCFIVAAVSREMRTLICYGANHRIAVAPSEVALV